VQADSHNPKTKTSKPIDQLARKETAPVPLTKEQSAAVGIILQRLGSDPCVTLGGYAGTGKSTILAHLANERPTFAVVTPTGKAAAVLRKKGVAEASTIHSCIYHPVAQLDGKVQFLLKSRDEIDCGGFHIDESSMVNRQVFNDLASFGLPIVAVGDHGQLEPVGDARFNLMSEPMVTLTTIHRNSGPIAHFAEHLRHGQSPWTFKDADQVQVLEDADVTDDLLKSVDQVIVARNSLRVELNNTIRDLLGYRGRVRVGERILCLRNNLNLGIYNGMQGMVTSLYPDYPPALDFSVDGVVHPLIPYDPHQFGKESAPQGYTPGVPVNYFDFAYVLTAHKSQGDEFDRVLVSEPSPGRLWTHERWTYTAASRARERLYWDGHKPPRRARPTRPVVRSTAKEHTHET
jgi:exodeoxyribonuclease-5